MVSGADLFGIVAASGGTASQILLIKQTERCRLELMSNEPRKHCSAKSDEQLARVVSGGGFMMIINCGEHPASGGAPLWNSVPATAQSLASWVARHLPFAPESHRDMVELLRSRTA